MAIVHDTARTAATKNCANLTYQKGNDGQNPPTWNIGFTRVDNALAETRIPEDGPGVNNTADAWLPDMQMGGFWLNKTPNTVRF